MWGRAPLKGENQTMKHILFKTIGIAAALALMLGAFTACSGEGDSGSGSGDGKLENGNVITVTEEGSEAELTAVREDLIKKKEIQGFCKSDSDTFTYAHAKNHVAAAPGRLLLLFFLCQRFVCRITE